MPKFTKKYIDNLLKNITMPCTVSLTRLTAEDLSNFKCDLKKNKVYTPKENVDELKEDSSTPQDDKTFNDDIKSKTDKTTIVVEPPKKKQKLCRDKIDVLKLVLSGETENHTFKSELKSSLEPTKEIASTNTEVPMVIDCKESTKSATSSAINVKPTFRVIDLQKIMNEDKYINWMKTLAINKPSTSGIESFRKTKVKGVKHLLNGNNHKKINLLEIEKLYMKYFNKSVQDTVVTIANLLNIISISDKYHEARINESFKKRSEAKKLKESCNADQLHGRHKKILETKLKNNIIYVISSFAGSEFNSAFQIFFLSILSVFQVLEQPKFRKFGILKHVVLLLKNSLKNSQYAHPTIFSIFQSKTFRKDCIDLISIIEDSQDIDPGVTDRMTLFFISTVNSREYFQAVIDAVTSNSNQDLALLIDYATFQCSINSKFKDPVDSSTVQHSNDKIPVAESIQGPINSDGTIQNWFLANNPHATYQQIPEVNLVQTNDNVAVGPSVVMSQPFVVTQTISNTIGIVNKQYQLRLLFQIRAVDGTNILEVYEALSTDFECNKENCNNSAKLVCRRCVMAKYCSIDCQLRDWHNNHEKDCQILQNKRKT